MCVCVCLCMCLRVLGNALVLMMLWAWQEYKDKVPQAVVDAVNAEIANVRGVMESGNADEIRPKVSALQSALMKIGESLAKRSDGQGSPQGGSSQGNSSTGDPGEEEKKEQKGP